MSSKNISQSNQQRYLDTMTTVTLKDVCSKIGSGFTPKGGNSAYSHTGVSLIRSQNVLDITFSTDGLAYINEEIAKTMDAISVQDGDVLLNITGDSVARVCIVPKEVLPARVNQHVCIIRADKRKINPHYILYRLYIDKEKLVSLSDSGATRKALTKKMIENYEFDIPPISYQNAVVSVIHSISSKIDTNNQINRNLLDLANLMYDHTFPYSIEDDLPEGWRIGDLDEIIEIHDSKRVPLSGKQRSERAKIYPYYGAASVTDYVDDYLFDGVYLLLGEDGTVVTEKGNPVLQYVFGKFWVNNHAHILTGKSGFSVESLYLLCQRLNIDTIITGAVQPKISQSNLKTMQIVIPPLNVIQHYSEQIDVLFKQLRNNNSENAKLSSLRGYLLPKLMSGEIDVSKLEITN